MCNFGVEGSRPTKALTEGLIPYSMNHDRRFLLLKEKLMIWEKRNHCWLFYESETRIFEISAIFPLLQFISLLCVGLSCWRRKMESSPFCFPSVFFSKFSSSKYRFLDLWAHLMTQTMIIKIFWAKSVFMISSQRPRIFSYFPVDNNYRIDCWSKEPQDIDGRNLLINFLFEGIILLKKCPLPKPLCF